MPKKIAVLGCGWLGFPLAKSFVERGYQVNGATTSVDKILDIAHQKINPFLIAVHKHHVEGNISYFLQDVDVLILNIPPRIRKNSEANYISKIKTLSEKIEQANIKKVIFASSTSVYNNKNTIVNDDTPTCPTTESGKQILASEQLLQSNAHFKTTVIRFAGLYGNDRHPVKSLSGKENIANPNAAVNLIHLDDCVEIINSVIEKDFWGVTFNACAPMHPTRKDFYTSEAKKLNIKPPTFSNTAESKGKTITSSFVEEQLVHQFKFPNLEY
ncbi:SDR family oxidoreductase [Joostella sp. CR20]|uniref:SDR family oxidoreductase n=1 Tax=Joostella sp. CR20 TaxID=2804312 RepID=UPI00313DD1D5